MTEPGDAGVEQAARARVLAAVADATGVASLRPPALLAPSPLRPLPAPLALKITELAARSGAGPAGADRPRRWWALLRRDPLRLTRADRRALVRHRSWESRRPWIGPHSAGPERALVTVACDVVARICATDAWRSPHLDGHRMRLDLAAELDRIDERAFSMVGSPRVEGPWLATVDRVAALDTYATHLAGLDGHLAALTRADLVDRQVADLSLGAERDGLAIDHLVVLAEELTGLSAAVVEITDGARRPRTG